MGGDPARLSRRGAPGDPPRLPAPHPAHGTKVAMAGAGVLCDRAGAHGASPADDSEPGARVPRPPHAHPVGVGAAARAAPAMGVRRFVRLPGGSSRLHRTRILAALPLPWPLDDPSSARRAAGERGPRGTFFLGAAARVQIPLLQARRHGLLLQLLLVLLLR